MKRFIIVVGLLALSACAQVKSDKTAKWDEMTITTQTASVKGIKSLITPGVY